MLEQKISWKVLEDFYPKKFKCWPWVDLEFSTARSHLLSEPLYGKSSWILLIILVQMLIYALINR